MNGADNNLDNNLDPYHALHLNKSTDSGNKSGNSGCAANPLQLFHNERAIPCSSISLLLARMRLACEQQHLLRIWRHQPSCLREHERISRVYMPCRVSAAPALMLSYSSSFVA